jgi:hypothetical protein
MVKKGNFAVVRVRYCSALSRATQRRQRRSAGCSLTNKTKRSKSYISYDPRFLCVRFTKVVEEDSVFGAIWRLINTSSILLALAE